MRAHTAVAEANEAQDALKSALFRAQKDLRQALLIGSSFNLRLPSFIICNGKNFGPACGGGLEISAQILLGSLHLCQGIAM